MMTNDKYVDVRLEADYKNKKRYYATLLTGL